MIPGMGRRRADWSATVQGIDGGGSVRLSSARQRDTRTRRPPVLTRAL